MTLTAIICLVGATLSVALLEAWAFKKLGSFFCLSQLYYEIIKKYGEHAGKYFTAWCALTAMLAFVPLHELTQGTAANIFTLPTCLGLLVVGLMPDYLNKKYAPWHYGAAAMAALGAGLICWLSGWIILFLVITAICVAANFLTKAKDWMLWGENAFLFSAILLMWCLLIFK